MSAPLMIAKDTNLLQMIQLFQTKKCSLAFITSEERKKEFANAKITLSVNDSFFVLVCPFLEQSDKISKLLTN